MTKPVSVIERLKEHKLHNSYWGKRIIEAEHRRIKNLDRSNFFPYTKSDVEKANNWTTCACGKQDLRIPRNRNRWTKDMPLDSRLKNLGLRFAHQIGDVKNPIYVANTLIKIEQRATEIIHKLYPQK